LWIVIGPQRIFTSIVESGNLQPATNIGLYPREDDLEAVTLLNLINKLIDGATVDGFLTTANIRPSNSLWSTCRVYTLHVDLDELDVCSDITRGRARI
jgi:hypothetical protein